MIEIKGLKYKYNVYDDDGNVSGEVTALDDVDLEIKKGEFIAILGHNGSGKSTLAKHINALLFPNLGDVIVEGINTKEEEQVWNIRQNAGMVFQNPDNQIIGQIVEEDVGFGPENLGVETSKIWERVEESLRVVGMYDYRKHSPNKLSGGQKQRVSIAGVIAMHSKCIIFDEPTAMLDPIGRKAIITVARALNQVEGITVILITHYMEEVINADRVIVMDRGKIEMQGTPREIFSKVDELKALRLDVPQVTLLADMLRKDGILLNKGVITRKEFIDGLLKLDRKCEIEKAEPENPKSEGFDRENVNKKLIQLNKVSHIYDEGFESEQIAIKNVDFSIDRGEFVGIIGHTGSGKSTLIQHINGLMKPTSGEILFEGENIHSPKYDRKALRGKVGIVFQYPEHQLFEIDVLKDVAFGPKNFGLSDDEAMKKAKEALKLVGVGEEYYTQSPFELSGGQKRRVAIAGVLAMEPEVLILDEPTAGLDPKGRWEILEQIKKLQNTTGITVVLISHSMEDVAEYVDRIVVMNKGSIIYNDIPKVVFSYYKELSEIGLAAPEVTYIMQELLKEGFLENTKATTILEAYQEIINVVKNNSKCES